MYPEDEFENPTQDAPVGAHRLPKSRWGPVIPFLVILVVVPLLAWGSTFLLLKNETSAAQSGASTQSTDSATVGQQSDTVASASAEPTVVVEPTVTPDPPATPDPTVSPSASPSETANPVDYATAISVLNASGIQGYAAEVAGTLTGDGFTDVTPGNTSGWITQVDTVYYGSADQAETAQAIADLLGISTVTLNANAVSGSEIIVLLYS